ncbi:MAG: response regulator [Gammaproteobacteria bacterium]|jgi:CheY-like chemotaxis protein|nr:response regulator [Xanthomonadales bacterium]
MKKSPRVLVVDDNQINRQYFSMALKKIDCDVFIAENAASAIELATSENFDLILMDIRMPTMSGDVAAKEIKTLQNHKNTPIVSTSAEVSQETQAPVFSDFLLKPISPQQLKDCVEKYCSHVLMDSEINVFNRQQAMKFCYNDESILEKLIEMFLAELPEKFKLLESSIYSENFKESSDIIHKLRGSCRTCAANELDSKLEELSETIKTEDTEMIGEKFKMAKQAQQRCMSLLSEK